MGPATQDQANLTRGPRRRVTAKGCGVPVLANFAAGLESDGAAIRAALTDPGSSGQAEGQINRLKLIKRQSYGRAGLDFLRRRMILAA